MRVARVGGIQVLELPYGGESASMWTALPTIARSATRSNAPRPWRRALRYLNGLTPRFVGAATRVCVACEVLPVQGTIPTHDGRTPTQLLRCASPSRTPRKKIGHHDDQFVFRRSALFRATRFVLTCSNTDRTTARVTKSRAAHAMLAARRAILLGHRNSRSWRILRAHAAGRPSSIRKRPKSNGWSCTACMRSMSFERSTRRSRPGSRRAAWRGVRSPSAGTGSSSQFA